METIIYKDYLIKPVYKYASGKTDFEVFADSGKEEGRIYPSTTLEDIKIYIDELTESL